MFNRSFWIDVAKDFSTSFATGVIVAAASGELLVGSGVAAAGVLLSLARASLGVVAPLFARARDEELGDS